MRSLDIEVVGLGIIFDNGVEVFVEALASAAAAELAAFNDSMVRVEELCEVSKIKIELSFLFFSYAAAT